MWTVARDHETRCGGLEAFSRPSLLSTPDAHLREARVSDGGEAEAFDPARDDGRRRAVEQREDRDLFGDFEQESIAVAVALMLAQTLKGFVRGRLAEETLRRYPA